MRTQFVVRKIAFIGPTVQQNSLIKMPRKGKESRQLSSSHIPEQLVSAAGVAGYEKQCSVGYHGALGIQT